MSALYYLKPSVQIEPLVNQWYAYPFLINPATYAAVLRNYQLSVMKSYLQMPMAHAAALKNPNMVGGPFIDYNGKRTDEVRALRDEINDKTTDLLAFAEGLAELQSKLKTKAKGTPLEALYAEIPEALKPYIELVYDMQHQPHIRLIEGLLYQSELYNPEFQSLALVPREDDHRSFVFSTPRLADEDLIMLNIPFHDTRIEQLVQLKENPKSLEEIRSLFGLDYSDEQLETVFTQEAPEQVDNARYTGEGVRVRYYGHACVLLESADCVVLTDPLLSYTYPSDLERFSYADLPEHIDYVVITHAHHDHIVLETLLQLRHKIGTVIVPASARGNLQDPCMKNVLKAIGFESVIEMQEMETVGNAHAKITGLPFFGEHCDLDIRSKLVYQVALGGKKFIMAADSSSLNPSVYKKVADITGPADTLFIGMECTGAPMSWAYGPLFSEKIEKSLDDIRRSNGSDAQKGLELADVFGVSAVYLYAMGAEPWLNYFMALQHGHSENTNHEVEELLQSCDARGMQAESLFAKKELFFTHEPSLVM